MNILIRNVSDSILAALDADAARKRQSRQELILQLLADWAEPPIVLGWFRADRNGELSLTGGADDEPAECVECGQPLNWPWIAILSNGAIRGPCCSGCARSD